MFFLILPLQERFKLASVAGPSFSFGDRLSDAVRREPPYVAKLSGHGFLGSFTHSKTRQCFTAKDAKDAKDGNVK
jgi:hypothetical protein